MSNANMQQSISHVVQLEDPCAGAHQGEAVRLQHWTLQESIQYPIQVSFSSLLPQLKSLSSACYCPLLDNHHHHNFGQ